jgi:HK97 family phage prohead protease
MQLNFNSSIEATDQERRIIAGKIVPFGEIGNTSIGKVVFEAGSINYQTGGKIKLLLEHSATDPIGFAQNISEDTRGLYATFKVSATTKGTDSLIEASENLRDGLSVGVTVDASEERGGVLYVQSAVLREVSLVQAAAFKSAAVESVAASEVEPEPVEETQETQPTESEASVSENATPAPEVEAAQTVEASRPTVTAPAYTAPRSPIATPADYLFHKVQATRDPGSESAIWVRAADDSTSNNAGLIPTPQLTTLFNGKSDSFRASIEAINTATLPAAGMSLQIPRIKTVPTVADTNEGGTPSETGMEVEFVTATVNKYAGQNTVSVELFDRSDPVLLNVLVQQMADAYALATNSFVNGELISAATLDATTVATYPTASELLGIVSRGAASVYSTSKRFARNMIASSGQWANIMTLNDNGRPIYTAQNPQNAGGSVAVSSLRGNVAGLDLYVDYTNSGDGDGTLLVVNPDCFTWYESPALRLTTNVIASGQIEIMYYGYGALANLASGGAFKNNKA